MPVYDFSLFDRLDEDKWITIDKSYNIIILEGLFAFHYKKLRDLFDLKIYMNTPEVLCFERRITRNVNSRVGPRGYTSEEYEKDYYNTFVYPSYKKYIEPLKIRRDFMTLIMKITVENVVENVVENTVIFCKCELRLL